MELIIGGAYQGKKAFAKKYYPDLNILEAEEMSPEDLFSCDIVNSFHLYIRKALKEEENLQQTIERMCQENPDIIIICDEIGYGVVPMDAFDRLYREQVGRIMTDLAQKADKVTRVICGIGTVIYHA